MDFDYMEEKAKLKKKIIIFLVTAVGFSVLFKIGMSNTGSLSCIFMGVVMGLFFYIPGRIREYFKMGWFMTVVISVIFILAIIWLSDIIGDIAYLIILLPFADMGYSIYKLVKAGKDM